MQKKLALYALFTLVIAAGAFAQPVITSLTPNGGAVGIRVLINGSGFESCPICSPPLPPEVSFGGIVAPSILMGNDLISTVVPDLPPGSYTVRVDQWNGSATAPLPFIITGEEATGYERILLPLLTPPVRGVNGSEFFTDFRLLNTSNNTLSVYGLGEDSVAIGVNEEFEPDRIEYFNGAPGRFIYVRREFADELRAQVRVYDATRFSYNFGTNIPIARERDFVNDKPLALLGVPTEEAFRNTLRIYSSKEMTVKVTYSGPGIVHIQQPVYEVHLKPGLNAFDPAYGVFTDFPRNVGKLRIDIEPPGEPVQTPVLDYVPPIWAFISVTNNETQMITTITP